jgi:peptidyl-prolyl cis-trans isomerase SurA
MLKKIIIFSLGLIFFIFNTSSNSLENKILIKIENQIITSLDVNNEFKYLVALNPSIKKSSNKEIIKLSKDQLYKKE